MVGLRHEVRSGSIADHEAGDSQGHVSVHETFRPVFRFRDHDGLEREAVSAVAKAPAPYAIGARVAILYDPARPGTVQPKDALGARAIAAMLGGLALPGATAGGVLVLLGP